MALIMAVGLFLIGVLATAFSQQLTDEFKAWIPWIVRNAIRRAVARLPEDQKDRFTEEWESHVNEVPGQIGKIYVALGFLSAARKMAAIHNSRYGQHPISEIRIRLTDLAFSVICIFLLAPLFLIVALWMRMSGRVLQTDTRVGLNGRLFQRFRFSRRGKLGKFLEATALFELPMMINILRGDMSIIGPRSDDPAFAESMAQIIPTYRERTRVKPGFTGWATVNRASNLHDELALDLFYIENRNLKLTLLILWRTLTLVIDDTITQVD
jgi:lipopolysaccharide/colanic/teichoic acid biosynthesis glycosyltransferase